MTRYDAGVWEPLGGGVQGGGVYAISAAEGCIYFGGSFTSVIERDGGENVPASYAARLCEMGSSPSNLGQDSSNALLEPVDSFESVGPIRALAPAAHGAQGTCVVDTCTS